jgi:hypothetical protein
MIMRKKLCLVFICCFLSLSGLMAQKLDAALHKLVREYPDERIHLHMDKDFYIAGKSAWFKAYLYGNNLPSVLSTNFYLQLLDKDGKLIKEEYWPVTGATVAGSISLPDSLPKGNYWLRAFTPWMMNFGEEFAFHRPLYIINTTVARDKATPVQNKKLALNFYPESGMLVDGITTSVAFQSIAPNGMPAQVDGNIILEDGTVISPFKTTHNGMGKFQFKPVAGNKYFAEVIVNGAATRYPLPAVSAKGVNLKVLDEKGGKMFQLARTEKTGNDLNELHLVVIQNKLIVFEADVAIDDYPYVRGHLLTDSLPSGIIQFMVFSKAGVPVAERLSFVNNGEYKSNVKLEIGNISTGKREKNSFDISFPDTLQRSFSVAVTDAGFVLPNQETIYSRFLLTSNLKGPVYDPAWYFSSNTDSVKQGMDLLMMVNGWTRYNWEKILNDEFPLLQYRDPGMMVLTGIVRDQKDKKPVQGGTVTLYIETPDFSHTAYAVNVDDKGSFRLDSMAFFGSSKIFYEYVTSKGKTLPVTVSIEPFTKLNTQKEPALMVNALKNEMAFETNQTVAARNDKLIGQFKVLDEVILQSVAKKKDSLSTNEKYATGVFTKEARSTFDLVANPPKNASNQNIVEFVKQNVPQVQFSNGGFVSRKNFSLQGGQAWPVSMFLDNSPITVSTMQGLMISEIALVKFYETGFFGTGSGASGGTIAVFTKKADDLGNQLGLDELPFFTVQGYSVSKDFYRPDYSVTAALNSDNIDNNSTLYWNSSPVAKDGKATVQFYNNDVSKKFRIVVEGFDATGKLIHVEKIVGQ